MQPKALKAFKSRKGLVSAVVPVEPDGDPSPCLEALGALHRPQGGLEALVARGLNPSRQRNLAARAARGEWLLFLDSDSRPRKDLALRLLEAAASLKADAAGGPNLPLKGEPWLGLAFSAVLGSYFGSMSARARYQATGQVRLSGEKELILCNLLVSREAFLRLGGFREDLYPNEENEFMNRLQASGGRLAYTPWGVVERPRRGSIAAFAGQAFRYGRGRMRQMRANFFRGDLVHLLPAVALLGGLVLPWLARRQPLLWALPLAYLAADAAACLGIALRGKGMGKAMLALLLFPIRHGAYGAGILAGLLRDGGASSATTGNLSITVERVKV